MMEWLAILDPRALIAGIAIVGLVLSLPLFVAAVRRFRRFNVVRGTLYFLAGGVLVLVVTIAGLVTANLYTYVRLTHEHQAAKVVTRQLAERQFAVGVQTREGAVRYYRVQGDEWQIDARVLKWRALGNLLGFDTVYRLERLSGRYGDLRSEREKPRTVHELAPDPGIDFWSVARRYHAYMPLADAYYGSAAYVPMAEGAEYTVSVSTSGLVVRPANQAARKALGGWK